MRYQLVPDFVLIDANELGAHMKNPIRSGKATHKIGELARMAREHGFALIVVDSSGLGAQLRDGLLPRSPLLQSFFEELRRAGLTVAEPNSQLLPAHLEVTPWGNPPHGHHQHHGSPQAIDRTGEQLAAMLAPRLSAHFDRHGQRAERSPAILPLRGKGGLRSLLGGRGRRILAQSSPLPTQVAEVELRNDRLEALVDLGRIEKLGLDVPASLRGVRSVARSYVLEDVRGQLVDQLHVRFVRFSNYDEYGRGTLVGAEPVFEFTLNRDTIEQILAE